MKVLLIEDNQAYINFITEVFKWKSEDGVDFQLHSTEELEPAFEHIRENEVDVILLDLQLAESSGINTLKAIQAECPGIPIVVLTCTNDENVAIDAMRHGAQDYLMKDKLDYEMIFRSITYSIERHKLTAKSKG